TEQELTEVNSQVIDILAGVNTLLTKNASIQADLIITDSETLATAQEIILLGDQTPAKYILNGAATVDHTELTGPEIIIANQLTEKLISITGTTVVSGTVNLTGLTSLLGSYTIEGVTRPLDSLITTIGGAFTVEGKMGKITYPKLRHVECNVVINDEDYVTELDFSAINTFGGTLSGGTFVSSLTTSVKTGKFVMSAIDANNATLVELGQTTVPAANLSITSSATNIKANGIVVGTGGTISVTATGTSNVYFTAMSSSSSVTSVNQVASFHIPALISSVGVLDIGADVVDASALTTIDGAADFTGTKAVDLSAVTAVTALLTVHTNPVNLPLAVFTGNFELLSSAATTVIVKSLTTGDSQLDTNHTNLTILSQNANLTLVLANNPALTTLSVTASGTGNVATFDGSLPAVLTEATVNGFITIDFDSNTSSLVTLTTAGTVRDLTIDDVDTLKSLNIGHTYDSTYVAAQDVTITGNALLASVDLATVVRLEGAQISLNPALKTILAPALTDLLVAGATTKINIGVAADDAAQAVNSVTATYTNAVLAVSDGITNTPYIEASVESASLLSWKNYILAISAVNSPVNFDIDADLWNGPATSFHTVATANTTATNAWTGDIDTISELNSIQ
ncbi:MAG: hypothetical protein ACKVJK_18475, partial [Methylophagaceae bacterium]